MDIFHFFVQGDLKNSSTVTYKPETQFYVFLTFTNNYILLSQENYEIPHKQSIDGAIYPVTQTYRQYFISFNQNIVNKQPSKWQSLNLFRDPSKHLAGKTYLNMVND